MEKEIINWNDVAAKAAELLGWKVDQLGNEWHRPGQQRMCSHNIQYEMLSGEVIEEMLQKARSVGWTVLIDARSVCFHAMTNNKLKESEDRSTQYLDFKDHGYRKAILLSFIEIPFN